MNILVQTLKKEKFRLETELQQQKLNDAKLKRKIESLEDKIHKTEEENNLLRNFNEVFGDENEKLLKENESLKKEVANHKRFRITRNLEGSPDIRHKGRKRSHSPNSSDEQNAVKARVRYIL